MIRMNPSGPPTIQKKHSSRTSSAPRRTAIPARPLKNDGQTKNTQSKKSHRIGRPPKPSFVFGDDNDDDDDDDNKEEDVRNRAAQRLRNIVAANAMGSTPSEERMLTRKRARVEGSLDGTKNTPFYDEDEDEDDHDGGEDDEDDEHDTGHECSSSSSSSDTDESDGRGAGTSRRGVRGKIRRRPRTVHGRAG